MLSNSNRHCILLAHSYLGKNGQRTANSYYKICGNYGENIWEKLVKNHRNIFMILCGHHSASGLHDGRSLLESTGVYGNKVIQILSDYQFYKGGMGYLRTIKFLPNNNLLEIEIFSQALFLTTEICLLVRSLYSLYSRG